MTLDKFLAHVASCERPSDHLSKPLQALWYAEKGNWQKAHIIAQDDASLNGSWVHANLHREEGDEGNAGYWYARAKKDHSTLGITQERHAIIESLLSDDA